MSDPDPILNKFSDLLAEAESTGDGQLLDELKRRLDETVGRMVAGDSQGDQARASNWHGMIGSCQALLDLRQHAEKFANANAPILIRGESGTGKDVVAKILHEIGPRSARPFVSENCAAIPHNLLESILFGHKKGAFTGAIKDHDGHFVAADKGTLLLDEVGDMPLAMQAKLLRTLQEGEVRAVGATKVRKVDVRVIAATNQDLEAMVATGTFREDLYYRLNVLELFLPPLRERGDDIVELARSFLANSGGEGTHTLGFSPDAEAALRNARWRGNVRQLQNEMQRVSILASGPLITAADLSPEI
ncbi:MAG: sigma-54 dependent transcriptional regulator [Planctomycetota bacterium]|nr:sigma-54 dependent transcriptional regulator [Planctomycetota bacterium]